MTVRAEPLAWAEQPFGRGSLGDQRRTRRLVQSAARSACHPEPSFPQVFDWNDLRGFYSVCHRAEATLPALPHRPWELTRSARRQPPLVLRGQDTSQMDFTRHPALAGTGPSGAGHAPGFWQHHSLAVVP